MMYKPSGVCAKEIHFDLDSNGCVRNAHFVGGCHGNLQGICALIEGMDAKEVIQRLEAIRCNGKATSCPHQLSLALKEAI